jgi:SHS2 domain-containing protein
MDMTERTFQILEHTADKGVAATGKTMAEAFENAAYGMFALFVDPSIYEPSEQREVFVEADDREQLLWTWLSELHFIFEVDGVLPVDFHIIEIGDTSLRANVAVRPVGEDIEFLGSPVKAVTYYQLKVEETSEGWRVQVYVDV